MSEIANFVVLTRSISPPALQDNPPNSQEYTYVASAINMALSMLESQQGRHHLADLAFEFDSRQLNGRHFHGDRSSVMPWVNLFLNKIRAQFPAVIIDHSMANLDMLGIHQRGVWEGDLSAFNPRSQMIFVNGQVRQMDLDDRLWGLQINMDPNLCKRVVDMIASVGTQGGQNFRNFQFLFATTLVHEAGGHLLVTFLGNGRPDTPPSMAPLGYGTDRVGESGRYLELRLFGGTTEYFRGPSQDMRQTGVPHQIDPQGRAWKIKPSAINAIVQYHFSFPLARSGGAVNPNQMRNMGFNSHDPPVSGNHRAMLAQQYALVGRIGLPAGYRIRRADARRVPTNPTKMLKAY